VLPTNTRGILENLAAYTAPFQIVDAALHLTKTKILGLKKNLPNWAEFEEQCRKNLARANRLTKCHSYSYAKLNVTAIAS